MAGGRDAPSVVLPLRAWLAGTHLVTLLLPFLAVVLTGALAADLRNQTKLNLRNQALILALHIADVAQREGLDELEPVASDLSELLQEVKTHTLAGIRVTDAFGQVVASSGDDLDEDLSDDVAVRTALAGRVAAVVRPRGAPSHRQPLSSPSRRARVRVFVAVPIVDDNDALLGTVIISRTPREELQALYNMAGPTQVIGGILAVLITLAGSVFASVVLTRNLRRLDQGARQIAGGGFGGIDELQVPTTSHVAEVARLAGSIASMAVRLQARIGYIGEFASNVSHEFKTPLATLKGTVELLEDDPEMPAEQRQRFFDNANRELARLEALVQGLLALARADAEPIRAPVDLDALVGSVAERRSVVVEGPFGSASGDVTQLELVLLNLVDNALQHGRGDNPDRQVTVVVRGVEDGAGFVVHDDGRGISPGNLKKVFGRFFTTDRTRGTGLGLALVRAIVERHGGVLTVRSEPGDTAFTVALPSAEIAPAT